MCHVDTSALQHSKFLYSVLIIDSAVWNSNLCSSQKVWHNLTQNHFLAMDFFFVTKPQNLILRSDFTRGFQNLKMGGGIFL